ncbi:MAG: 30S ribosomal protein S2 [Dehalococcoidales bacterium]|nr:30S ribosomal protein S2 [Dehalococcoidales bacterium]MDP6737948.1 30S ribosomal protein S2 [Dehalococcoidales bacterium]
MLETTSTNTTTLKQLLEAGAHFGHQTSRWHPRMKSYIFTKRNGIHIIDLEQTVSALEKACAFVREIIADGGHLIFVGTKKQAQETIQEEARRCGAYYVNQRWIGGILTNFSTIQSRIDYLVRLEDQQAKGEFSRLPKKEAVKLGEEIVRLNRHMGGFKEMTSLPSALFIVDVIKERISLIEARKVGVPVVAVTDTNTNPDEIDYPIPANDDAIRAIRLICGKIAGAVLSGKADRTAMTSTEDAALEEVHAEAPAVVEDTTSEEILAEAKDAGPTKPAISAGGE